MLFQDPILVSFCPYFEADAERERQGDHDEGPRYGGEEPPAQADAAVGLVRCKEKMERGMPLVNRADFLDPDVGRIHVGK